MASEEDLAALRLFYREVAHGNFWVGEEVFDPDIEWQWSSSLGAITGGRTYRGFEEVSAATKDWLRSFEWFRIELEELVDMGEKVVALTRSLGRPRGATADVMALNADVWTMRDGKAVAHRSYDSWDEALEAAEVQD
jgi:ketosteroid isomerase-like protein